jgi:hypothetical protein
MFATVQRGNAHVTREHRDEGQSWPRRFQENSLSDSFRREAKYCFETRSLRLLGLSESKAFALNFEQPRTRLPDKYGDYVSKPTFPPPNLNRLERSG